jgi:transposase
VHPADIHDRAGAKLLLEGVKRRFPDLSLIWADQGYNGKPFADWVKENLGSKLEVVNRPKKWGRYAEGVEPPEMPAFTVLKRRWVVERTFAWEGRNRRLSRDYEGLPETEEAYLYLGMVKLMLRRLAKA